MAEDDDEARAAGSDEKADSGQAKSGDESGKEKDGKRDDQKDRRPPAQKQADERKARRRKILIRLIFILVLVVAAIGAFLYWYSLRDLIDTDDAFTEGRAVTIAPRISGQVVALDIRDNQRVIEFEANSHRHFDHGYAVTSHSAQGLTAERVLVHANTCVHPDLLNSRITGGTEVIAA